MDWKDVDKVLRAAVPAAEEGDEGGAWSHLQPLIDAADADPVAARGLAIALGCDGLERDRRLALAQGVLSAWPGELAVLSALGEATESLADGRYLNAAPPADAFFGSVAEALTALFDRALDASARAGAARGLTSAARILGHRWSATGERAHRFLLGHEPQDWQHRYNFGLFLKTRGRFAEAVDANREAAQLGGANEDSVIWNLGICATAVGEVETALSMWRRIGCRLEIGEDGLPAGRWDHVQVHLAERPLAARDADHDDPGGEETVWIERLSPCHGRVVSALYQDLGVDYGDLVLFDGAPILTRTWGSRSVPVFPHLVTLRRGGWSVFWFAATQEHEGQVAALGARLGDGVELYVHTEKYRLLCRACWERKGQGHPHDERAHRVVTGKLVVPPRVPLGEVGAALLRAETASPHPRVYLPDLWTKLGDDARADVDRRRYRMLTSARPQEGQ